MLKRILIFLCALCVFCSCPAQQDSTPHLNKQRLLVVGAANALLWGGSYVALNKTWYAGYARTGFHLFDDLPEWNQMDKGGHIWTSYHISRLSYGMWKWTGFSHNNAAFLGGASGVVYQSIVELQDAYSSQWGFSWSDMAANAIGSGLFVAEELAWKDQRIQIKLGSHPYDYPGELLFRRNQLFGNTVIERILKDYNSQTYWVSANMKSFFPASNLPPWLNISVGYSADGMYGGRSNIWVDKDGHHHDYSQISRTRKWYLSPDIDLTKIRTRSKLLRSALNVLNMVKVPAPAIEISNHRVHVRAIKF